MKKLYFIAALLFFVSTAFSQVTFVKGYIVALTGDTLKGEVKINPKKEFDNFGKVFFKDASGVQKNYKANKVKAYGFENKNFLAADFEGEPMFYRILSVGTINLLEMMYETMQMNEISYKSDYYLAKKGDNVLTKVKPGKFKKQLTEMMKDNAELLQNMDDDKKFEIEKVTEVVNQYNDWAKSKG